MVVAAEPLMPWHGNGIDIIYTLETSQLSCSIRFTKIAVATAEVATSCTPKAQVQQQAVSGVYVNCSFLYNNELMAVTAINGDMVTCRYVNEDSDDEESDERGPIDLPMETVVQLIASFGR